MKNEYTMADGKYGCRCVEHENERSLNEEIRSLRSKLERLLEAQFNSQFHNAVHDEYQLDHEPQN
jgi:hypothetical protein